MKIIGLIFLMLVCVVQTQAKTLFIVDIDDTIKNAHVLDKIDAVLNADKVQNSVLAMSTLLNAVDLIQADAKFYYVSNAPKTLMESNHRNFLKYNVYPPGALRLRDNFFQSDFKVTEIRKILADEKPQSVIFLGDNGEKDIFVYEQITREFPGIAFATYIRQVYSSYAGKGPGETPHAGQIGYVTPLELALFFRQKGLLENSRTIDFVRDFVTSYSLENEMNEDGPQAIPAWVDCRELQWSAPDADYVMSPGYQKAKDRILERCSVSPLKDL